MSLDTRVADAVAAVPLTPRFGWRWRLALGTSAALVLLLCYSLLNLLLYGVGVWGTNIPFVWGFDLINYSWWIGVANGANLVAALLVIRRNSLRTAVNRFAESAALFALICAGIFPIFHLGKPWLWHWVFPYPHTFQVWPQFRSTLTWDFWAISAYAIITFVFWSIGLVPDLATLRDRARPRWAKLIYGFFALGWRGSVRHWALHQTAYRFTAGLLLPLILVMQTIVALEHAVIVVPGWHEAGQPIHFIVTGLGSGLATVLLVAVLFRVFLRLDEAITEDNLALIAKLLAATTLVLVYVYATWAFIAFLAEAETREATLTRIAGTYAPFFWGSLLMSVAVPQLLWLERVRRSMWALAVIALSVSLGIWFDRFSVLIGALQNDYLPTPDHLYWPTLPEFFLFAGTLGLFAGFLLLFVRTLPAISIFEMRQSRGEDDGR